MLTLNELGVERLELMLDQRDSIHDESEKTQTVKRRSNRKVIRYTQDCSVLLCSSSLAIIIVNPTHHRADGDMIAQSSLTCTSSDARGYPRVDGMER